MVLIGLIFGALSGYGLGFLGLFGRIVCSGLLFLHASVIVITMTSVFIGTTSAASRQRIEAGSMTEYLTITLGFDAAIILSGRAAGVSTLDWWVVGGAAVTLVCVALLVSTTPHHGP